MPPEVLLPVVLLASLLATLDGTHVVLGSPMPVHLLLVALEVLWRGEALGG